MKEKYQLGLSSNIFIAVLPNGSFYPDHIAIEDERTEQFIALYDTVRTKPWERCNILDLGCGEGSSGIAIARTGARVTGIDGRKDIITRAEFTRAQFGYNNIEFRQADILDESVWQDIDAVFMAGLIHHLSDPFQLIDLLKKYCSTFAFMCTHVAPDFEK